MVTELPEKMTCLYGHICSFKEEPDSKKCQTCKLYRLPVVETISEYRRPNQTDFAQVGSETRIFSEHHRPV